MTGPDHAPRRRTSDPAGSLHVDGLRVVTVTWNSRDVLPAFLAALRADGVTDDQLVVVDNASSDGTVAHLDAAAPAATVLRAGRNAGYAAGLNLALAEVPDEHAVLVLNPDTRIRPGTVQRLLATASTPGTGVVAPALVDDTGAPLPSARHDPVWWRTLAEALLGGRLAGRLGLGELVLPPPRGPRRVDWATGAALLLTPAARALVPRWEESYFLYSEEVDHCQRVRAAGLEVVVEPRAVVAHRGGDMAVSPRLWALRAVNRVLHVRRREPPVTAWLFHLASLLFELRRAATGDGPARAAARALRADDLLQVRDDLLPDDVDAPLSTAVPVVLPAHQEAEQVEGTLRTLLADAAPGELDVLVVVNGSTDDTADRARSILGPDRVLELEEASKVNAIRAAEHHLGVPDGRPVVYQDSDVALGVVGVRRLVRLVTRGDVEAAAPTPRYDLHGASLPVRSYLRVWQHLPFTHDALSGTGVYVLSPAARARFTTWPDVVNDDGWINARIPRARRRRAPDVTSRVGAPPDVASLVRRKVRVEAGNAVLREDLPHADPPTTAAELGRILLRRPWLLVDLPAFLWITWLHRRAGRG